MLRAGRRFGKLAWKGVKLEVWAFAMLMLQLLLFLSFLMVVEEILPVPGRGPPSEPFSKTRRFGLWLPHSLLVMLRPGWGSFRFMQKVGKQEIFPVPGRGGPPRQGA